jgi:hypothetical protein
VGSLTQFNASDYLLALPMLLLTWFALGILLIDLIIPPESKWLNPVFALIGVLFAAGGVFKIQSVINANRGLSLGAVGMMGTMRPHCDFLLLSLPRGYRYLHSHVCPLHDHGT